MQKTKKMDISKILESVNSAKTNEEFSKACDLIKDEKLRERAKNVIWYSMTLEQDKKMVSVILNSLK